MTDFHEQWGEKKPGLIARALASLKKGEKSLVARESHLETKSREPKSQLLPNKLLRGWTVPVVGESFYSDSFQRLYALSLKSGYREVLETATLRIDPTNVNSSSGKAVAVYIADQKVGYVAERICEIVFDGLVPLGGSGECECSISFDTSSGEFRYNSVELRMILPPTLESNNSGAKVPSLKRGQSLYKVGSFKISTSAGSLLQELSRGQTIFMKMNFNFSGDKAEATTVEGERLFTSQIIDIPLPFTIPTGGTLHYLESKAVSLGDGVFELFVIAAEPIKAESTRTGDALSEAGNVLSSRYELGLIPSGKWLKIKYEKSLLSASGSSLFVPDTNEPTKYFWARISQGPGLWSPLGFRGDLYRADLDKMTWNLNTVPSFWVLVRASLGESGKGPIFEVDFNGESPLTLFPQRPLLPAKAIASNNLSVSRTKSDRKSIEHVTPDLKVSEHFSLGVLDGKQITTTGFDYLEQNYLVPTLESLGFELSDSVTKSRTGLLVGGSNFELEDSGKAKSSARFGIPIVTIETLREQLHQSLEQEPKYKALCRYEEWLETIGISAPHAWNDQTDSFDFQTVDAALLPGAALDERNIFSSISFIGSLVGLAESKAELSEFFKQMGGEVLDSVVVQAEISFKQGNAGLVMELHRNGVFLGRTPANQTESLAESARLYDLKEAWVKISWLSIGRFKAEFSFFGHS